MTLSLKNFAQLPRVRDHIMSRKPRLNILFFLFLSLLLITSSQFDFSLNIIQHAYAIDSDDVAERTKPVGRILMAGDPDPIIKEVNAGNNQAEKVEVLIPAAQPKRKDYPNIGVSIAT